MKTVLLSMVLFAQTTFANVIPQNACVPENAKNYRSGVAYGLEGTEVKGRKAKKVLAEISKNSTVSGVRYTTESGSDIYTRYQVLINNDSIQDPGFAEGDSGCQYNATEYTACYLLKKTICNNTCVFSYSCIDTRN